MNLPELRPYIEAARRMSIAEQIMRQLARPAAMTGEIRPTDMAAVIAPNKHGERSVFPMLWVFYGGNLYKPLVNCRVETARVKPLWSDSWKQHRCVIPASFYYEWQHYTDSKGKVRTGAKYAIQPRGSEVTYLAGLYRIEKMQDLKYPVFAVLTRAPTDELRKIHDRIPLIPPEIAIDEWTRPDRQPNKVVDRALTELVIEKAELLPGTPEISDSVQMR